MSEPLGDDLDLPFEKIPGGPIHASLDNPLIAGGLVVQAALVPSDAGTYPALVFRFHLADGTAMPPVVLVANADQMGKVVPLVAGAVAAAVAGAERAS
jgi:hypothetical protein